MFQYFVRPPVCLSVSPSTHRKHVGMLHFISSWVLGGRDVGLSLDLCFGGGGSVFLKLSFVGGGFSLNF